MMKPILLILSLAMIASADRTTPEKVLARMREAQKDLATLRARITQVKSYPQLGFEDPEEKGHVYIDRGNKETRFRLDIEEPERRTMLVTSGRYTLYQPRIKQAVVGDVGTAGKKSLFTGILTGSSESMEGLERDYTAESLPETKQRYHLKFVARPGAEVYCQEIELWLDEERWLPFRQTCREANQSLITFTLTDIEVNEKIDPGVFELQLPSDVEKVKG
jgi:outer membrane lipoprotein-sorting protein